MIHCLAPVIGAVGVAGPHRARVGARAGLGQRERPDLLPGRERGHVRGAVVEQRQRARARVDGDGHADAGVGARELLQHLDVGEEVRARAALLDRHADAHQPELAELGEQLAREVVVAVPRGGVRRDLLVGEAARERADLLLLGGQLVQAHEAAARRATSEPAPPSAAAPTSAPAKRRRRCRCSKRRTSQPSSRRHPRERLVGIDRDGVADRAQHRQVGLGVRVAPRGG